MGFGPPYRAHSVSPHFPHPFGFRQRPVRPRTHPPTLTTLGPKRAGQTGQTRSSCIAVLHLALTIRTKFEEWMSWQFAGERKSLSSFLRSAHIKPETTPIPVIFSAHGLCFMSIDSHFPPSWGQENAREQDMLLDSGASRVFFLHQHPN